jgi:hypothetical protein
MSHTYLLSRSYWLCHTHICCLELTGYVTHMKLLVMSHTYLLSRSYWLCHTHICCLEVTGYVTHISAVWNLLVMSHTYLLSRSYWLCHTHICCLELTGYVTHNLLFETYLLCHTHICCLDYYFDSDFNNFPRLSVSMIVMCFEDNPPGCTEGRRTLIQLLNWSYGLQMMMSQ